MLNCQLGLGESHNDWCFSEVLVAVKFSSLLILIGLALDPMCARAQLDGGNPCDKYTNFEACQDFLDGDQNIEKERWDIDFGKCLDRWPELSNLDK